VLERFASADTATVAQPNATCCYAKSDKGWARDPKGIKWEAVSRMSRGRATQAPLAYRTTVLAWRRGERRSPG